MAFLALLTAGPSVAAEGVAAGTPTGVLVGRVIRVQDGDSLVLSTAGHQVVVRLAGIDAPELSQPRGMDARERLRSCAAGRSAVVTVLETDRYGRSVGLVDTAGEDCALSLLRAGLAWSARYRPRGFPVTEGRSYETAERSARRAGLGLWRDDGARPPWEWRRDHPRERAVPER